MLLFCSHILKKCVLNYKKINEEIRIGSASYTPAMKLHDNIVVYDIGPLGISAGSEV